MLDSRLLGFLWACPNGTNNCQLPQAALEKGLSVRLARMEATTFGLQSELIETI